MAVNQWSLFTGSFVYAGPTTLTLKQLQSQSITPGANKIVVRPGGSLDPAAIVTGGVNPSISLSTRDLSGVLSAVSLPNGLYCTSGCTLRFQKRAEGAAFLTGTSHHTLSTTKGFLQLDSISADAEGNSAAQASLTYLPLYDGTNAIIVSADSVDFDAETAPAFNSVYFMGPAYLNGVALPGLKRLSVNTGLQFTRHTIDGNTAPTEGAITARDALIEMTFLKANMTVSTMDLFGVALGSQLDVYFEKGFAGSARANLSIGTNHIKISAAAGEWGADQIEVSSEDSATITVTVRPTGTLSLSTASNVP